MAEQDIQIEDTTLSVWAERDRLHVALYLKSDKGMDDPLLDLWDESAREAFEDGFLKAGWLKDEDPVLKASAYEYAKSHGLFDPDNRVKREPVPTGWVAVHDELGAFISWKAGGISIWSSEAEDDRLAKGAHIFGDEEDALDWFKVESGDEDEMDENEEFLSHITAVEVVVDLTAPGDTRPRKASTKSMEESNIDLKIPAPALSI